MLNSKHENAEYTESRAEEYKIRRYCFARKTEWIKKKKTSKSTVHPIDPERKSSWIPEPVANNVVRLTSLSFSSDRRVKEQDKQVFGNYLAEVGDGEVKRYNLCIMPDYSGIGGDGQGKK